MNTATVTWLTFENNGTFLQAYALQQAIKSLGYNNVILDDNRIQNKYKEKPNINFYLYKIVVWFKNLLHLMPPSVTTMTHHFYKSFRNHYLDIYEGDDYANKYDVYICGSDQIWSPFIPFIGYYYLDFTSKKKIAYAPSVGTYACSEVYKKNVSICLRSFSYISTRERVGKEVLSQLTDKPIKVVVDPTLLLRRENWEILVEKKISDDYIFCYFLTPNQCYVNHAFEVARTKKLKLRIFYTSPFFYKFKDDVVYGGPKEFLSYIKCAKMVLTDSFHATVFSLLFQQDFITYKRFKDGGEKDQNARIYNLLTPLHLLDRFVDEDELKKVENREQIDYVHVQNIMENIRVDSLNYLKIALSNE